MPNRRMFAIRLGALALASPALSATAAFADRTVTIVVPFPAGSAADANVRVLAEKLRALLHVSVVIDNKAGANGIIGTNAVVRASPDGYTLLYHSASLVISPWLIKDAPDPTRTLVPIGQVAATRMACLDGMDQETLFLKVLERTRSYAIEGDHLILTDESHATLARFTAVDMR